LRPLRHPLVVRAMASLFAAYLRLVYGTLRWTQVNRQSVEAVWREGGPVILCFWHYAIPLSPRLWPKDQAPQPMRALISRSRDGEFITQIIERLGFGAVRGSSQKKTDLAKNKHGEKAFREMVRLIQEGVCVAVTPDGPRGPALEMQKGVASLARITKAPVLMVGLAASPSLRLSSWDRTLIPLPFGRGAMVWADLAYVGRADDTDDVMSTWTERLRALDRQALALASGQD
jgi:lysophospholipid acyltransferase (LPLAT)-like uncharacterized protein